MLTIIIANLLRRPARTIFTAAGIALGIAMIVALLAFSRGLQQTAAGFVHLGGSDLGVFQSGVADPTASVLPESLVASLAARPEVERATPLLLIVEAVSRDPAAIVFGADPRGFVTSGLVLVAGRRAPPGGKGSCWATSSPRGCTSDLARVSPSKAARFRSTASTTRASSSRMPVPCSD